jgi:hypothetical protein
LSINQDFYAKVLTANLSAILAQPAQQEVTRQSQSRQYAYQVNFTHLLSKMKDSVVYLLRGLAVRDILDGLWQIMLRTVEPIRPGRRYPRSKARTLKRFSMTYKPVR